MAAAETKRMANFPLFDWLRIAMANDGRRRSRRPRRLGGSAANLAVQILFALSGWLIGTS